LTRGEAGEGTRTPTIGFAPLGEAALYRLLSFLSPGFPTGAFSYSHGLEAEAHSGTVRDRASLERWIAAILSHGSGRIDAAILRAAHEAAVARDDDALDRANARGLAFRATPELALEASGPGAAFLATCRAAWAEPFLDAWREDGGVCYPAALGAALGRAGVPVGAALLGYLHAFAANLVSAGLRLGLVGQTDGQRILAALEPVIAASCRAALAREPADFGSSTIAADLASIAHETQYTRLFRS
jgi:urease accessory protein